MDQKKKNAENSRFIKRTWLSLQYLQWCVCFHYSRRIPQSLPSVLEFRHQSIMLKYIEIALGYYDCKTATYKHNVLFKKQFL